MGKTKIEWTDITWNPVRGCSRVSEGCRHCYAEQQAMRIVRFDRAKGIPEGEGAYDGLVTMTSQGPKWTGEVRGIDEKLLEPLRWRKPRRVFVNSMSDLFHENLTTGRIAQVMTVIREASQHTFQVLTKRPERMLEFMSTVLSGKDGNQSPPPNLWLGVSVEDQATADQRIPLLLRTPAAVRFISAEPLLGPVCLTELQAPGALRVWLDALRGEASALAGTGPLREVPRIDWVIAGGESGRGARLMKADWLRSLRDQCRDAGVPFFFKQWGGANEEEAGRLLDGVEHNAFPEVSA